MRLAFALVLLLAAAPVARAQVRLVADGAPVAWEGVETPAADRLADAPEAVRRRLALDGFPLARVDSLAKDTLGVVTVFASRGPRVPVASLAITGASALSEAALLPLFDTRPGQPLDAQKLRADIARVLARYEAEGLGLAQISIQSLHLVRDEMGAPAGLALVLQVDEGRAVVLRDVLLPDGVRLRPAFAARLLGVQPGKPLRLFSAETIRARLEGSALFGRVGPPQLVLNPDGTASLRLDVAEASPGAFDLVLGLLPPDGSRARASLVGSGQLVLLSPFGRGQRYEVRLNRMPGRLSLFDAQAGVPYVLGLPLRLEAAFSGTQQDSTYGAQKYRAGAAFGQNGREVVVSVSREGVRPGVEGARVQNGQQRVARSQATFAGVGFRIVDVDAPLSPRRGYRVESLLERGTRRRSRSVETGGATVREHSSTRQERLTLSARLYRPLGRRAVAVAGLDGYALRSPLYEEAELFRLGGAATLRGYDESRFRARYALRALAETRLLLDRLSYAFAFFDGGYIDQPAAPGVSSLRGFYPGYGIGMQLSTGIGLVVATYAASPEAGLTAGRIHLGLSLGL